MWSLVAVPGTEGEQVGELSRYRPALHFLGFLRPNYKFQATACFVTFQYFSHGKFKKSLSSRCKSAKRCAL